MDTTLDPALELDPLGLNVDLREIDTNRPVIKDGKYLFTIKELSKVEKKDDSSKHNLKIVLALAQAATTPDGDTIMPGYTLRRYLPLQQSETEGASDFRRDLVLFLCAAFNIDPKDKTSIPSQYPPLEMFINRQLQATVKVKDDDTGKSNDVGYFDRVG